MPNGEPEGEEAEVSVSYDDFKIFANNNPGSDNADFYKAFPSKPQSTIRRWKVKYLSSKQPVQKPPEQQKPKVESETLIANNKALMQGTMFTEKNFKGMSQIAINKFLLNFRNKKKEEPDEEDSNSPIVGTPVGSGRQKMYIDQFLTMDPKMKRIDFEAPASIVFGQHKNRKEAENKWVQP
jgi:hypothetical protein